MAGAAALGRRCAKQCLLGMWVHAFVGEVVGVDVGAVGAAVVGLLVGLIVGLRVSPTPVGLRDTITLRFPKMQLEEDLLYDVYVLHN